MINVARRNFAEEGNEAACYDNSVVLFGYKRRRSTSRDAVSMVWEKYHSFTYNVFSATRQVRGRSFYQADDFACISVYSTNFQVLVDRTILL